MSRRIVISGAGCLSAAGSRMEDLGRALEAGTGLARAERIELGVGEWLETEVARIPDIDRGAFLPPARRRRMSLLSQNWVVACLQARADAQMTATPDPERAGVVLGTCLGSLENTIKYLDIVHHDGMGLGNPFLFSESVANAPAGHAAIDLDCRGFNVTLTCGAASGLMAVQTAARAIRDGRIDLAFAGGIEEMPAALLVVLARLGAIPARGSPVARRSLAHVSGSRNRAPGEGAACFILETEEGARRRGVEPYAEVLGCAAVSDPHATDIGWSHSVDVWAEMMRRTLEASGVAPQELDGAMLHACGDPGAERAECEALERVILSEKNRPEDFLLGSPSQVVGQLAGAGAFGVAAAILALKDRQPPGDAGHPPARPASERGPRRQDALHILVNGGSWGGSCSGLLLGRAV
ncbi:MAG: beta-ketoacyl synthase N-terminal-like domain-containing protein [Acidobacteria bacterium]|nr:beta-ketoacyl synthase N-terminal-like domain-containing protein [Acidobacteriota bacterium]